MQPGLGDFQGACTSEHITHDTACGIQIPYTIVRTNSDYVHVPVAKSSDGMWMDAQPFLAPNFELGKLP